MSATLKLQRVHQTNQPGASAGSTLVVITVRDKTTLGASPTQVGVSVPNGDLSSDGGLQAAFDAATTAALGATIDYDA